MNQQEQNNVCHRFKIAIEKMMSKERRENIEAHLPEEYAECLVLAVQQALPNILTPRKPGRPKKDVEPDDGIILHQEE